jgi:DNA-directed RNA polymerase subunit alpha
MGITLGNSLRRMLLSYLPGAAITSVKIEGIQHEFSTIPDVKEDTIEFLLNVKAIRLKALSGRPGKLIMEVNREGEVHASDIQGSDDLRLSILIYIWRLWIQKTPNYMSSSMWN